VSFEAVSMFCPLRDYKKYPTFAAGKWGGGFFQTIIPGYATTDLGATVSHSTISAIDVTAYDNSAGEDAQADS
jgi:hypothetical protein